MLYLKHIKILIVFLSLNINQSSKKNLKENMLCFPYSCYILKVIIHVNLRYLGPLLEGRGIQLKPQKNSIFGQKTRVYKE